MKIQIGIYTILVSLLLPLCLPAQTPMQEGVEYDGEICNYSYTCPDDPTVTCDDPEDLYQLVVPDDGTVVITGELTRLMYNNSNCTGMLTGIISIQLRTTANQILSSDSGTGPIELDRGCVAAGDTFLVRIYGTYGSYSISYAIEDEPGYANDPEPNDMMASAIPLPEYTTAEGHIDHGFYQPDDNDYYRIVAPHDGDFRIPFTFEERASVYLLDKSGATVLSNFIPTDGETDTLFYGCAGKNDTFFIHVEDYYSGICYGGGYELSWQMTDSTTYDDDPEPNDDMASATPLPVDIYAEGRLDYGYYDHDQDDYYRLVVPHDGGFILPYTFEDRAVVRLKDKSGQAIFTKTIPAGGESDTFSLGCVAENDTFFLHITDFYSLTCSGGGYVISWHMSGPPDYENDAEPNDGIAEAIQVPSYTEKEGRIGFGYYDNDLDDYYCLVAPSDGTLCIPFEFGTRARIYLRSKDNSQVLLYVVPEGGVADTLRKGCVGVNDTFYLHIEDYHSSICWGGGYAFSWQMCGSPGYADDPEPNDDMASAVPMPEDIHREGRIDYGYYQSDDHDFYSLAAPRDGAFFLSLEFEKRANVWLRDKSGASVAYKAIPIDGGVDTIFLDCVAENDSFFVEVADYFAGTCYGGGYKLGWHMYDLPAFANDAEPNDELATAADMPPNTVTEGRLDYGYYGDDDNDYYRMVAFEHGDIRLPYVFQERAFLRLLNRDGGQISLTSIPVGGASDTLLLSCVSPSDTFYLHIEDPYDPACYGGGYQLQWSSNSAFSVDTDPEPNDTRPEAYAIAENTYLSGHIGFGQYEDDPNDWAHTEMNGIGGVIVKGYADEQMYFKVREGDDQLASHFVDGSFGFSHSSLDIDGDLYFEIDAWSTACNAYEYHYYICYDANDSGNQPDTLYPPPLAWHKDHIGFLYGGTGRDNVDVHCLTTLPGDTLEVFVDLFANTSVELIDGSGTVLFDTTANGPVEFEYLVPDADQYCLRISYVSGSSPYCLWYSGSPCPEEITVSGFFEQAYYKADDQITSDAILTYGGNALLRALNMLFTDGFEIKAGAEFETVIEDCDGAP